MVDPQFVHDTFSAIASRYVAANHILSLGADILWRSRAVQIVADWHPSDLLDVATGTGDLALDIRRELPETHVLGLDFCEPMLAIARRRGLTHTLRADAMHMPFADASFDALTIAFGLRNLPNYAEALREFKRVLKSGGHLLVLDFSLPDGIAREPYRLYLHHILPHLATLLTGKRTAYAYLGQSIEQFPSGEAMLALMRGAGFICPTHLPLCGGIAAIYTAEV